MKRELRIYFLCGQNRCRSQIAEAYAKQFASEKVIINSAGLEPSPVHPLTIEVMREENIDISNTEAKKINMKTFLDSTVVVKLCKDIKEKCPVVPFGIRNEQWNLRDPLAQEQPSIDAVREVRDEIKGKVVELLQRYNALSSI